ncbi:hypothetical protein ACFLX7_01440 [Chloroflexota bacterium]
MALGLLVLFFMFRRQHISITEIECAIQDSKHKGDTHPMGVCGFIQARHPIELLDCKLMIAGDSEKEYPLDGGVELNTRIDHIRSYFEFDLRVDKDYAGGLWGWGLVYIRVAGKLLYIDPFPIKAQEYKRGGWLGEMAKKITQNTKHLQDKGKVSRRQLHDILDKASQPVKKSEKGKPET